MHSPDMSDSSPNGDGYKSDLGYDVGPSTPFREIYLMSNNTRKSDNTDNTATVDNTDNTAVVAEIVAKALNGDFSGYTGADVTIKANVRKALKEGQNAATRDMDLETALRYMTAIEGCVGQKAAKAAVPVNHAQIIAKRAYLLIQAGNALLAGTVPNGLNPEDVDNVAVNAAFVEISDNPDFPYTSEIQDIATQKVTKSSERVDIGAHIASVIEGAESGTFFSVRKIASTSTESAPNGCPSDGAVAMRLFPQKGESTLIGTLPIKPALPGDSYNGTTAPVKGLFVL